MKHYQTVGAAPRNLAGGAGYLPKQPPSCGLLCPIHRHRKPFRYP